MPDILRVVALVALAVAWVIGEVTNGGGGKGKIP